jgi:hypothetical protein
MSGIDVICIATNGYTSYWLSMIESFLGNTTRFENIVIHVATDDPKFIHQFGPKSHGVEYRTYKIDSEPWPMATLLRYKYISEIVDNCETPYFLYIDADMYFHKNFDELLVKNLHSNGINFIHHPGYWRDIQRFKFRTNSVTFRMILGDIKRRITLGGLGAWETRKLSEAYVPRASRKIYICGGIWFGTKQLLIEIVTDLNDKVNKDLKNNIIAIWHDESHLNRWYSEHGGNVLDPSFCYDPTYQNLSGLTPLVQAIQKNTGDRN